MEYGQQGQHGYGTTGRVDQYGNPVGGVEHGTTGTGGMGYGTGTGTGAAGMGGGQFQPAREEHKTGGIMDKIKEQLPGQHATATGGAYGQQGHTGTGGTYGTKGTGEKKGIMDKIKEQLPGPTEGTGEKKGIMDKIKEKLPGQY